MLLSEEIASIPDLLRQQLVEIKPQVDAIVTELAARSMQRSSSHYYSMGWGSSGCLASWFKFVAAELCAWPISTWEMALDELKGSVMLNSAACLFAFSQSGSSKDLGRVMEMASNNQALTIACVNKTESPLADLAKFILPTAAGPEQSLVATKSFLLSATAILYLLATLNDDDELLNALHEMPVLLEEQEKFPLYVDVLQDVNSLMVLGHAYTDALAKELALKFKEGAFIHAEGMNFASFLHGPIAMLEQRLNILALLQQDADAKAVADAVQKLVAAGAAPLCIAPVGVAVPKEFTLLAHCSDSKHPACAALLLLHQAYRVVAATAQLRNIDPEASVYLQKETITE